jgi:Tfp pilus assembly PilM family ATPase
MSLLDRLSLASASSPGVAVEISAHYVSAAAIEPRGGRAAVSAHAAEALPPGAVVPALAAQNIHNRPAVAAALGRVLDRVGRVRRLALVVPDMTAKVSMVRFEQVPSRAHDLDQLIRWQVRKTAPFAVELAQMSYVKGHQGAEGQEFIVTLARRDVVEEYEAICAAAGAHAGLVDIVTFNVINAVVAGGAPAADWLVVNVAADAMSVAILRGAELMFFRNRASDGDGTLADLVHQTAMYYEDRLQGPGLARVLVSGGSSAPPSAGFALAAAHVDEFALLSRSLEERVGVPVEAFDPRTVVTLTDRIAASPILLDMLAPLVGVIVRGREVAA